MIEDHCEYASHQYYKKENKVTLELPGRGRQHSEWSPYEDNGGTAAAIAGKGYVIVAGDTRLNGDFCFHTRNDESKLFQLTPNTFLASGGCKPTVWSCSKSFATTWHGTPSNNGGSVASTQAISQLLSTVLYRRRFFPYYTFNIIAGINEKGDGVCYSYDAVGCTEPLSYGTTGTASSFIEP